jgi:hypothetical protein
LPLPDPTKDPSAFPATRDAFEWASQERRQVIVDDLGFFDEPYVADGPAAAAALAAVSAGVSFHSAAGNDAEERYEGTTPTMHQRYV